jgi:hypothetical protein
MPTKEKNGKDTTLSPLEAEGPTGSPFAPLLSPDMFLSELKGGQKEDYGMVPASPNYSETAEDDAIALAVDAGYVDPEG